MSESFDSFNAPQFVDFSNKEHEFDQTADAYFDVDPESERSKKTSDYDSFYSPVQESADYGNDHCDQVDPLSNSFDEPVRKLRKSMSVGNLILFSEQDHHTETLTNICENINEININHSDENEKHIHFYKQTSYSIRTSAPKMHKKLSQDYLNKLAQPKRFASVENLKDCQNNKFVSLAESVKLFQNRTPVRFRSKPNLQHNSSNNIPYATHRTVPQSPALQTKARSRPVYVLSQEEREKLEFEKEQKYKIKAHPVNKKILQGPVKPTIPVEKKAPTVPQPFNLTLMQPKKVEPPKKYEFHARPVPKSAEKPHRPIQVSKKEVTKPITPRFMKNIKPSVRASVMNSEENGTSKETNKPLQLTRTVPFSFETRDKMILAKREKLINKVLEEERRAREFHAKPLPKNIYRNDSRNESGSSRGSSRRNQSTENLCPQFKARPPTVLYKEPFIPAKPEKPLTEIIPFQLNTEQRSQEREQYEKEKQEKERRLEYYKRLEEEERIRQEQEEIARIRKQAEHKAQPIKKYKEVIIKPSNKVTEPISPKFKTDLLRQKKNKENIPENSNNSSYLSC